MTRALRISLDVALLLAALAVLAVVGSGGTTLTLPGLRLGLNHLENPLLLLMLLLALRALITDPESGWEGSFRRRLARLGLRPSQRAAGVATVLRASLLFAGLGLAAGLTDALQTWIRHPDVAPDGLDRLALACVSVLLHLVPAWLAGLLLGALILLASRLAGVVLTGYGLGRAAALTALLGGALLLGWIEPEWSSHEPGPGLAPLTLTALLGVGAVLVVFLGLTALLLSFRRRPALTLAGGSLAAVLVLVPALLPGGGGGSGGAEGGRPSLLLVTVGSLRADALAVYGGTDLAAPQLDSLARGGALVEEALTPFPATLPALISLHLGQAPEFHGHRSVRGPYRGGSPTLAEILAGAGYRCAAFVGSGLLKARRSGLDAGFGHYDDRLASLEGLPLLAPARLAVRLGLVESERWSRPVRGRPAEDVVGAALRWIERAGPSPWMVWVHLDEPRAVSREETPGTVEAAREAYARAVAEADRQLGRLLEGVKAAAGEREVLVALTADRGEALGEDGLIFGASRSLADAVLRIPMILAGPGIAEGRRVAGQASLAELSPTLAALLGVAAPARAEGEALWEPTRLHELVAAGSPPPPAGRAGPPVCLESAGGRGSRLRGLRWAGLKLVLEPSGAETLLWVEKEGETRLERDAPGWEERLERMEAELTTCRLVAEDEEG
jgi:arylsulfatase A-like enzyme